MRKLQTLVTLAVLAGLTACASMGGGSAAKAKAVDVTNGKAFGGKQDVAIGSFAVTFVTFDKSSAKAQSPMTSSDSGFAKATLRAKLDGIDDATFQALTDQAYADFTTKLRAAGYNVVDRGRLASAKAYGKLSPESSPRKTTSSFKMVTGGSREDATFAPSGMPLYGFINDYVASPMAMYGIAEEAGVPALDVRYTVHFVYFGGSTSSHANANTGGRDYNAQVTLGQGVQVVGWGLSSVDLAAGQSGTFNNPNGTIKLHDSIVSPEAFGETSDATSGAQKAANAFSAVVGVFSGGSMSAKELLITADPAKYSAAAHDVLGQANDRLVAAMSGLR